MAAKMGARTGWRALQNSRMIGGILPLEKLETEGLRNRRECLQARVGRAGRGTWTTERPGRNAESWSGQVRWILEVQRVGKAIGFFVGLAHSERVDTEAPHQQTVQ